MRLLSSDQDRARFQALVMPYLADAYALAVWLTGSRTDAEDVAQEAFLRAFAGFAGFVGINGRAWLLTIVRHTAYDWLHKNRPGVLMMVDNLAAIEQHQLDRGCTTDGGGSATPETALIAKADAERLEAAIAELPLPFRETLVLREVHGLTYHEIAEMTKVPLGTVMSRLARARRQLLADLTRSSDARRG